MSIEYRLWARSRVWIGEVENPAFPPVVLGDAPIDALLADRARPQFQGTAGKKFADLLARFFLDFDNKLLTPSDARATADWLRSWAGARDGKGVEGALRCADWLDRASAEGWYVDWSY